MKKVYSLFISLILIHAQSSIVNPLAPPIAIKIGLFRHADAPQYNDIVWQPKILCLEITQQCDNPMPCTVCASDSSIRSQNKLNKQQVLARLKEAKDAGLLYFAATGGEPTLEEDTLFEAIEYGERIGVRLIYINTNCFNWGESVDKCRKKLHLLKKLKHNTWEQDHTTLCISMGDEHQRGIPLVRVVNFIEAYQEVFPGTTLEAIGLRFNKTDQAIQQLIKELFTRHLIESKSSSILLDESNRVTEIILANNTRIAIFYNYVVPINRAETADAQTYEHFHLDDIHLKRPISSVPVNHNNYQTLVIGWDNKASPDIVFKCTETLVIPDSDKKTISQIISEGNQDPLLRAGVESVWRIIEAAKLCEYGDLIEQLKKKHSTIHGLTSELISDPERKRKITNIIIHQDIETLHNLSPQKLSQVNGEIKRHASQVRQCI